jgi:hypothetical protein
VARTEDPECDLAAVCDQQAAHGAGDSTHERIGS